MFDFVTLFSDLTRATVRATAALDNFAASIEERTGAHATAPQSPVELPAAQPVKVRKKPGRKPRLLLETPAERRQAEANGAPHVEPVLS